MLTIKLASMALKKRSLEFIAFGLKNLACPFLIPAGGLYRFCANVENHGVEELL